MSMSLEGIEAAQALTLRERDRLAELEGVIARGVRSFLETGRALTAIRDEKLYREHYATFDAYTRAQWGFRRSYAYEIMQAAEVAERVSGIPDAPAPRSAGVAAELIPVRDDPESLETVWRAATSTASAAGRPVTADDVREARKQLAPPPQPASNDQPKPEHPPEPAEDDGPEDPRFAHIEEGVQILKMLPSPGRIVWPTDEGDLEAVGEAVEWLARFTPALAKAWREHKRSRRRLHAV